MLYPFLHSAFWALKACLWASLLIQGVRLRLAARYPLVFAYIISAILADTAGLAFAWFLGGGGGYSLFFLAASCTVIGLAIAVLLELYFMAKPPQLGDLHLVAALATVVILHGLAFSGSHLYLRILSSLFLFQAYLGIGTLVRLFFTPSLHLGRNWAAVRTGLILPGLFQAANNLAYLIKPDVWAYPRWVLGFKLTAIFSWLILARGMRDFDPPRRFALPSIDPLEARKQMKRLIRLLWDLK